MPSLQQVLDKAKKVEEMYKKNIVNRGNNLLVMGDYGTGKSVLARTARKPVYFISFDPGGASSNLLRPSIESGEVIVDDRFETLMTEETTELASGRTSTKTVPSWNLFVDEFEDMKTSGFFDHIGTLYIDSLTNASKSVMASILSASGRQADGLKGLDFSNKSGIPQLQDYLKQQMILSDLVSQGCSLPCDFVCTGHISLSRDEVSGAMYSSLLITGKLVVQLPLLFDEVWITMTKGQKGGQASYTILTQPRTRLGAGLFEKFEEPDIKKLYEKAGLSTEDKPLLNEINLNNDEKE